MQRAAACVTAALFFLCCGCSHEGSKDPALDAGQIGAITAEVHTWTQQVARDVTTEGPRAWLKYLETGPEFFMAVNGHIQFQRGSAVAPALEQFAAGIEHIALTWGADLRIDPLTQNLAMVASSYHETQAPRAGAKVEEDGYFTALAERRPGGWQFRNAHWSMRASLSPGR